MTLMTFQKGGSQMAAALLFEPASTVQSLQ
jgi:hypothetical protein